MPTDKKSERKDFKIRAKSNLKRHYWLFVAMCVFAASIGSEFVTSDYVVSLRSKAINNTVETAETVAESSTTNLTDSSAFIDEVTGKVNEQEFENEEVNSVFARSKGTLNAVIDYVSSGTIISNISSVVLNIVGSESVADTIMIAVSSVLTVVFWFFVSNLYSAVIRRLALEGRIYAKIPFARFLYFIRIRKWFKTALTMALYTVCVYASLITVIGFPVIYYGLFMMPFIVAENPDISAVDALKLSWKMMKGKKMDLFKLDLTLVGWYILGVVTFGVVNIFFANPYRICVYSEFYTQRRQEAIKNGIEGSSLLCDRYLFAKADLSRLKNAYPEIISVFSSPEYKLRDLHGAKKFFAEHFGVVLWNTPDEKEYEENQARRLRILYYKAEAEGMSYPTRLGPVPDSGKRRSLVSIHYMRHYSLLSLVSMFFIYSIFGWTWEVIYYYILQGHYINRGVLHGPWLPIYGAGGLLILIFLFPLRKNPVKHFVGTVVLCGALEYFASVILEYLFDKKWWDYSGFFLNINGRICAEGLFVFGVAGLAFIYVLSPLIDDKIRKINPSILLPVSVVLITLFAGDLLYSHNHPNTGDGITDNFAGGEINSSYTESTAEG